MKYKKMFIEKYNYLYKNADFFCIGNIDNDILNAIKQVFLECESLTEIEGYKYLENLKNSKKFLKKYEKKIMLNNILKELSDKMELVRENNMIILCQLIYDNIEKEDNNIISIRKRQDVIDEFARVSRYSNDGTIWTSGTYLNSKDMKKRNISIFGMINNKKEEEKLPIVVEDNKFIEFFSNSYIDNKNFDIGKFGISKEIIKLEENRAYHFSEKEKQKIFIDNNKYSKTEEILYINKAQKVKKK